MVMRHDCIMCELVHGKGKWNREKQVLYLHNQMERPLRTPIEALGTDLVTSAVIVPATSHCSVH